MLNKKIISIVLVSLMVVIIPLTFIEVKNVENKMVVLPEENNNSSSSEILPAETIPTPSDWFLGESVKTDIEFNYQGFDYNSLLWYSDYLIPITPVFKEDERYHAYANDGNYYIMRWNYTTVAQVYVDMQVYIRIYCGGAGTLSYEQYGYVNDDSVARATTTATGTLSVTTSMLDSLGYLNLYFLFTANAGLDTVNLKCYYYNIGTGWVGVQIYSVDKSGSGTFGNVMIYSIWTDYFYFSRTTIINNIRSEYCYTSDTIITHKLIIPSVPNAKEINVYYPTTWTYSSVNPYASVSTASYTATISSPTELTYTMFFNSNCSNILALEDVTDDYLIDIGFENGKWLDDFETSGSFSSNTIATNIVSEGYYSLYSEDGDALTESIRINLDSELPSGYYYISFDVYITSFVGAALQFQWYDFSNTLRESNLDTTILNRWQKCFFAIEYLHDGSNYIYPFENSLAESKIYLDNFKIFQVSTEIETVDLDSYEITNSFITWDGYQNLECSSLVNYNMTLWDRCSQTVEWTILDNDTVYELSDSLAQKEYDLNVTVVVEADFNSTSYYFTPSYPYHIDYALTEKYDEWDFTDGDQDGWSHSASTNLVVENGYFRLDTPANYGGFLINSGFSITADDYDYIMLRMKANDSISIEVRDTTLLQSISVTTTWTIFTIDVSADSDWTSSETYLYLRDGTAGKSVRLYLDYVRIVHVEQEDVYESDTYLGIGSENDLWVNSVWHDDYCIGIYNEFSLIGLSGVTGVHNITWIPFSRQLETKAFLQGSAMTNLYQVSIGTNYYTTISTTVDADGGYFYTTINTYWANCTYRVADNGTWLGSAVSEGAAIWSFVETNYGLHNFSIVIYNGGVVWDTIYTSVTIVDSASENNFITALMADVDVDGGLLYTTVETSWANCTYRVKDNATWLGSAINEGSASWTFDEDDYGFHNFSIVIYQGGVEWATVLSGITIVEPDPEVLALYVYNIYSDADAGLLYIDYATTWGNTTLRIKDNGTWLGAAVSGEENSIWTFTPALGYHNFTIIIYSNAVAWFTSIYSLTINTPYNVWRTEKWTFRSEYDGGFIDADRYLDIFFDGELVLGSSIETYKDFYNLTVYDKFGNLLYENTSYVYQGSSTIRLPLRALTITNNADIAVIVYFQQNKATAEGLAVLISSRSSLILYLQDGEYSLNVVPMDEKKSDSEIYTANEYILTLSATNTTIGVTVDVKEDYKFQLFFNWERLDEGVQRILNLLLLLGIFGLICVIIIFGNLTMTGRRFKDWIKVEAKLDDTTLRKLDNIETLAAKAAKEELRKEKEDLKKKVIEDDFEDEYNNHYQMGAKKK